ncbi:MAG: hypothetical protein OJJ55_06660 [Rhodococcus sp.]|nr:hypothetical protein [Rhodococcus sp. (in: high G+C Gram-positive bacteria)]
MSFPPSGQYTTGDLRGPTHSPRLHSQYGIDVVYTINAEAANTITVNCQFNDPNGDPLTYVVGVRQYLSSDSAGQTPVATVTTLAAGTDGTILVEDTSNSIWYAVTEADGDLDIVLGDATGGASYYLNTVLPSGRIDTSAVITFTA